MTGAAVICGLVLAGGRSSRFGSEKAVAKVGGLPLIARVTAVLQRGCAEVAVNARAESAAAAFAAAQGLVLLHDAPDDPPGPLAGIRAGLTWARRRGARLLVTAPCDTPFLAHDLVARLAAELGENCGAAVARSDTGVQPLCALWRVDRLDVMVAALADGRHPAVHEVLSRVGATQVQFEDRDFLNVNTREDQARAAARA